MGETVFNQMINVLNQRIKIFPDEVIEIFKQLLVKLYIFI